MDAKFVISRNIRYRRQALGLSQKQLAERVYFSRNAVSMAEKGSRSIASEHLPNFAEVLGVKISDLFEPEKFYKNG